MIDPTKIVTGDVIPEANEPRDAEASLQLASQWRLMWWRFRKHKLALVSGILVIFVYLVAAFVEFLAPFPTDRMISVLAYAPPQRLRLLEKTEEGLNFGLHVYGYTFTVDALSLKRTFEVEVLVEGGILLTVMFIDQNESTVGHGTPP